MNILKIILLGIFSVLFINTSLFAQQQFFHSTMKPDTTGESYGMYINSGSNEECFFGYEFHADHDGGQHDHYRIAMRASTQPGSNGVFIAPTGQLAVGSNDPCARILDSGTMLSVEGGAIKLDNASWDVVSDKRLKKNISLLKSNIEKFLDINFVIIQYKFSKKLS